MPHTTAYKLIPIDSLAIQEGYNTIRTDKELKQNVKDVEALMEQQSDDAHRFPIRYVTSGKQKFTRNHATLIAAQNRGWKEVYAIELPYEDGSVEDITDLLTSNNGGHPVSRVKQGELYLRMSEGELKPDLENGKEIDPETDYVRKPMSDKEIAEAFKPVYSTEHIRQCKVLASTTPEIQELMESGDISANIVIIAQGWAKGDNAKQLRILKAAAKLARDEGAKTATKKHMDAIKSDFVKLKAAPVDGDPAPAKPKGKGGGADNNAEKGSESSGNGDAGESDDGDAGGKDEEAENLFAQSTEELLTEGSKKNKKLIEAFKTLLLDDEGLEKMGVSMTLNEGEAETLAEALVKIAANAREVF